MNQINSHLSVKRNKSAFVVFSAIAVLLLMTAGCQPAAESEEVQKQLASMRGLAVSYGQYCSQHRGRPPRNEEALKKFIESQGELFLEGFGATEVDELFVSPRDGEPYVVIYGKPAEIVAYEQTGVDGKRYVADNIGAVEELDEATFDERVPVKK